MNLSHLKTLPNPEVIKSFLQSYNHKPLTLSLDLEVSLPDSEGEVCLYPEVELSLKSNAGFVYLTYDYILDTFEGYLSSHSQYPLSDELCIGCYISNLSIPQTFSQVSFYPDTVERILSIISSISTQLSF